MNNIELFLDFTNSKNMAIVNRRGSLIGIHIYYTVLLDLSQACYLLCVLC